MHRFTLGIDFRALARAFFVLLSLLILFWVFGHSHSAAPLALIGLGTNVLQPYGLVYSRQRRGSAPTFQANKYKIKAGYATKIAIGDVVETGTGGNQGYVILSADNPGATGILGVFAGVLGYFDNTAQQFLNGLNGSWPGANANASADVDCLVIDDPDAVFRTQVSGGPWLQSWRGQNINWLAGTNGVPNAAGYSTLVLDGSSVATTNTKSFRIQELVGVTGGPQDPANTNPFIEVCLNFGLSEQQLATGI